MKLMRILFICFMMMGLEVVAAEEMSLHVDVVAEPNRAPESAFSPSPKTPGQRFDFGKAGDTPIQTSVKFDGSDAEEQLQTLVDDYVKAGSKRKLQELLDTSKSRPENLQRIIEMGLKAVENQQELEFREWFDANKDNQEELEHQLPLIEKHVDITQGQRVSQQIAVCARKAVASLPPLPESPKAQRQTGKAKTVDLKDALLIKTPSNGGASLAPTGVALIQQPEKRSWKKAVWLGVGTGIVAVAAAVIWYVWFKPVSTH